MDCKYDANSRWIRINTWNIFACYLSSTSDSPKWRISGSCCARGWQFNLILLCKWTSQTRYRLEEGGFWRHCCWWKKRYHLSLDLIFLSMIYHLKFVLASIVESSELRLPKISRLHMGDYLCVASNGIQPSTSKKYKIGVQCKYLFLALPGLWLDFNNVFCDKIWDSSWVNLN